MVVNELIEPIKRLGFSEYEAKAYLCLLRIQPATAYEIAQASGIPSSKIYEIIARLVDKQVFMPDGEGSKKKYMALLPDEFIDSRRREFDRTLSVLERDLPALRNERAVSFIWNIGTYEDLMARACRLIDEAEDTLLLSAWAPERESLEPFLVRAEARTVRIAAIHFGHSGAGAGAVFYHPIEDTIYQEKGGRGLVLVADGRAALVGTIDEDGRAHGAFSANPGFITLAEDYIKHDIYIMKIIRRFDGLMVRTFGDNYTHLRNIFEDKDEP
ncbi:helix-turn-helix domain-containing protein [Desulfatiferula olefinivorans]